MLPAAANVAAMEPNLDMSTAGARILMVDDDPGIRDVVSDFLGKHGYKVDTAGDAAEMEQALERGPVDLIVLDVMLPGEDGLAICRRFASSEGGPPIIMLSAMGEDTDRIVGLELGADDYVTKPFSPRELLARIKAVLRRTGERGRTVHGPAAEAYGFGPWVLRTGERELVGSDGVAVPLSTGEYNLLLAFVTHPKRVLTRDQLLELARGPDSDAFDRAIDVQISRLRRKLDDGGGSHELIRTIRNEGYMLTAKVKRT